MLLRVGPGIRDKGQGKVGLGGQPVGRRRKGVAEETGVCLCTRSRGPFQKKEEQMQRRAGSETQHAGEPGEDPAAGKTGEARHSQSGVTALLRGQCSF